MMEGQVYTVWQRAQAWEIAAMRSCAALRRGPLNGVMHLGTFLADGQSWTLICALSFFLPVLHRWAPALAFALVFGTVCSQLAKRVFRRPRPSRSNASLTTLATDPDHFSFPSGHTTAAFAGAMVLSQIPGFAPGCFVYAVWVGFSRVYLGAHYPLDVLFGALLGVGCGWLGLSLWGG